MTMLVGLTMVVAGILIAWRGRPAAGGTFAAIVAKPGMGVLAALLMTALIVPGGAIMIAGAAQLWGY